MTAQNTHTTPASIENSPGTYGDMTADVSVAGDAHHVHCDGLPGDPALGHPRVYYTFDGRDTVVCGYCDRRFTRAQK